jgi:hypothetical protein
VHSGDFELFVDVRVNKPTQFQIVIEIEFRPRLWTSRSMKLVFLKGFYVCTLVTMRVILFCVAAAAVVAVQKADESLETTADCHPTCHWDCVTEVCNQVSRHSLQSMFLMWRASVCRFHDSVPCLSGCADPQCLHSLQDWHGYSLYSIPTPFRQPRVLLSSMCLNAAV